MEIAGKIAFLDRKLEHDVLTVRLCLAWMVGIPLLGVLVGFGMHAFQPSAEVMHIPAWVPPGLFSLALPKPILEYFARRQSIVAVTWLRDQYQSLKINPDSTSRTMLDQRFTALFDKVAVV